MAGFALRFRTEPLVSKEFLVDSGAPSPFDRQVLRVHPAADEFFDAMHDDGWVLTGWDYGPWYGRHAKEFRSPQWIASLTMREIQQWLTYFSRELRGSSLCPPRSITAEIESGTLLAVLDRIAALMESGIEKGHRKGHRKGGASKR
jgi:hypothetical protein